MSRTGISELRVPELDELPQGLQDQISDITEQLGHTPNWIRAIALGGEHTERFTSYLLGLLDPSQGRLPHVDREVLATVTSAENGCSYCRLNHAGSLGDALGDHRLGARVSLDYREVPELSERHRVLAEFAVALTHDPRSATDEHIARLRGLSLDDEEIYEAAQVVSAFAAANRFTIFLRVTPDEEFFGAG